jgi:acyl-CoA reductase-like NAD-dependent aldehyde dehydrogenase
MAEREENQKERVREWIEGMVAKIRDTVAGLRQTAADVLSLENGRELRREVQETVQEAVAFILSSIRSVEEKIRGGEQPSAGPGRGAKRPPDRLSKKELYELAKKMDIQGRSKMSKQELAEAIRQHG